MVVLDFRIGKAEKKKKTLNGSTVIPQNCSREVVKLEELLKQKGKSHWMTRAAAQEWRTCCACRMLYVPSLVLSMCMYKGARAKC